MAIELGKVNVTDLAENDYKILGIGINKSSNKGGIYKVLIEQMDGGLIESKIESTILDAVSNWLPYLNIDEIIFDYDNNDIDNNRINLELKFSLVSNPNLGESVTINVNNN